MAYLTPHEIMMQKINALPFEVIESDDGQSAVIELDGQKPLFARYEKRKWNLYAGEVLLDTFKNKRLCIEDAKRLMGGIAL